MNKNITGKSRKINPLLGLFGILGLIGPIAYHYTQETFMIAFIGFIGFFGFFFEGKITYEVNDEWYIFNEKKAALLSIKFAFITTIICMILSLKISDIKLAYTFLIGSISLIWGISIILYQYLLYKLINKR